MFRSALPNISRNYCDTQNCMIFFNQKFRYIFAPIFFMIVTFVNYYFVTQGALLQCSFFMIVTFVNYYFVTQGALLQCGLFWCKFLKTSPDNTNATKIEQKIQLNLNKFTVDFYPNDMILFEPRLLYKSAFCSST